MTLLLLRQERKRAKLHLPSEFYPYIRLPLAAYGQIRWGKNSIFVLFMLPPCVSTKKGEKAGRTWNFGVPSLDARWQPELYGFLKTRRSQHQLYNLASALTKQPGVSYPARKDKQTEPLSSPHVDSLCKHAHSRDALCTQSVAHVVEERPQTV